MKKNIWWLIALIVVIVLIIYLSSRGGSLLARGQSLRQLFEAGLEQKCLVEQVTEEGSSESIIYTSEDKLRSDLRYESGEATTSAHILIDGEYVYTWVDDFNLGIRTAIDDTSETNIGIDQKFAYHCAPWETDRGIFELPDNVQFTNIRPAN